MATGVEAIQPEIQELNVDDVKLKEDVPVAVVNPQQKQQPSKLKAKKIGHRRVDASTGVITYKKTPSSALSGSIQLGISHTVAGLSSKPERDVLMQDFQVVETISFPAEGSNITPAHHYGDFTFRTYAPTAFRYFRDLFGIRPDDYMLSISNHPLTELSNPGASGSLFFVTHDDAFIIKTVQHKEAEFLQKLLPGYYLNLVQNPRTLLPKFYGLYNVQSSGKNIRVCVMNNLLPSTIKMNLKYDLKGSTYKRKASKKERNKKNPTFKDLDLLNDLSEAPLLDPEIQNALVKTMQRDCLVLQSFKIMDYSMLLAIHNVDKQEKEDALKANENKTNSSYYLDGVKFTPGNAIVKREHSRSSSTDYNSDDTIGGASTSYGTTGNRNYYSNLGAVMSSTMLRNKYEKELDHWSGGIPARNSKGEKLLLFCGIIDILQCYKLKKKLEHTLKALYADSDAVSVHRPAFYCDRFQRYMIENVFRPIKSQPTAKRNRSQTSRRPQSAGKGAQNIGGPGTSSTLDGTRRYQERPDLLPEEPTAPFATAVPHNKESFPTQQSEAIQTTNISPPASQTLSRESKETTFDSHEEKTSAIEEIPTKEKDHSPTTTTKQPSSTPGTIQKEPEQHHEESVILVNQSSVTLQEISEEEDTDQDTAM